MMLLDTDAVIDMLKTGRYEVGSIFIITLVEVLRGIAEEKRSRVKELVERSFKVLHLDNRTIETYCKLHDSLKAEGKPIPDANLLIAATTLTNNLPLKTKDKRFQILKSHGLKLK